MRASPITPTLCTGSSTAKLCQMRSYQPALRIFVGDDGVGLLQQRDPVARDLAEDADRQARARERLADQELLVDAEVAADARALRP